ncbi:Hypothetical predicted protein [Olea europaea subsp. europaea]|uniref:Uncharacterized protein n=1 Tax=Olea europaea subsp. europaea TaxID=158383 RepID=A0A8S0TE96_OLEEU|nr:Hypothetical predicted protein [Olea europaea subsp. europaea]
MTRFKKLPGRTGGAAKVDCGETSSDRTARRIGLSTGPEGYFSVVLSRGTLSIGPEHRARQRRDSRGADEQLELQP